jgi:succinate dehydrogenase / fumarate reductase iron-sulfur subunit
VDRRSFDRIIQSGGYISVSTGNAPDGNAIPVGKEESDAAMDAAACIACGACVAACPNGSAALFTGAKIAHLGILPQGHPEQDRRAVRMVSQMNVEGFGSCTNIGECTGVCPKEISLEVIAKMNHDYWNGAWKERHKLVTTIAPVTDWNLAEK